MVAPFVPSAAQRRMLEALGTYRLLNVSQMLRLGVGTNTTSIRDDVRVLAHRKLLDHSEAVLVRRVTSLPALHWLTEGGARILQDNEGNGPQGARRTLGDKGHIEHRMAVVEAHIALRQWASREQLEVKWFFTDFEPGYGGRHRLEKPTLIPYPGGDYIPDAVAAVCGPDGISRLLVFEVERGRADRRPGDFFRKLPQLAEVCDGDVLREHFGGRYEARFLVTFPTAALRDRVLATWPDRDADRWQHFFVKADHDLADFNAGWWRPGGDFQRPLFAWGTSA